jgi:WD40 repeat protein
VFSGRIAFFVLAEGVLIWFLLTRGDLGKAANWADVFSLLVTLGTAGNACFTMALSRVLDGNPRPAEAPPPWLWRSRPDAAPGGPVPAAVRWHSRTLATRVGRLVRHPGLTAALMVVAFVLIGGTVWLGVRLQARDEVARADAIAFRSQQEAGRDPALANALAAEALGRAQTPVTWAAAMAALSIPMHDSALLGRPGAVAAMAVSPDGSVAAAPAGYSIRLWDIRTRREVGSLIGHDERVTALAFSADGAVLASGSADGTIRLWDVASRRPKGDARLGHMAAVTAVAFVPGGRHVASAGDDARVRFWRLDTGEPAGGPLVAQVAEGVTSLAVSPDGRLLVTGSSAGRSRVWDLAARGLLRELPSTDTMPITAAAFSPDGRRFATAGANRVIRLWNTGTLAVERVLSGHSLAVTGVAFNGTGTRLASTGQDATVRLWDLRRKQPAAEVLTGHQGTVTAAAFLPGEHIVSAGDDGTLRLWAASSTRPLGQPLVDPADTSAVNAVAFAPNGRTLASVSDSGYLRFWDARTRSPLGERIRGGAGTGVAVDFTADGREVLTAHEDGAVRVWDAATHDAIAMIGPAPSAPKIWGMDLSPDGGTIATAGDDGAVRLWDRRSRRLTAELRGHSRPAQQVAFSRDGRQLASTSDDGSVLLWDLTQDPPPSNPLRTENASATWGVAFNGGGTLLAVAAADRRVYFWNPRARKRDGAVLQGHTDAVDDVAFNRDGTLLATTSGDRTVRLWTTDAREMIGAPLVAHNAWVDGIAFSPQDNTLATTGNDGAVRLWDLNMGGWREQLCRRAARPLSADEWSTYVDRETADDRGPACAT